MTPPRSPRVLVEPVDALIGWGGAAGVALLELSTLGLESLGAVGVALGCFAGLALIIAWTLGAAEAVARRQPRPWARAFVRAAPSVLVMVPVARHLFEGAFASTLPGASTGPLWVPVAAMLAAMVVLRIGEALLVTPARRWMASAGLVGLVVATAYVNRTVRRSEYPDIHTLLVVVECVGLGLALRLPLGPPGSTGVRAVWLHRAVSLMAAVALVVTLRHGLQTLDAKRVVATEGMHTRLLVRVARALFDRDDDGYATVLGGGDCDDAHPDVHPSAIEVPGNAIDEDCDGSTEASAATRALAEARREHRVELEAWRATPEVEAWLGRLRSMNVVLIAVDTLRADVLEDTPANRERYPNFFALRDASVWFSRTFAPSAGTDLSMSGLLTGRVDPFVPGTFTLPEAAHETGRRTHAVLPSEVIRYVGKGILTRGLDDFDRLVNDRFERDVGSYTTSARTLALGLEQLDTWDDASFFLWLHFFDVHEHQEVERKDRTFKRLAPEGKLDRADRYRVTVQVVDEALGELMSALRERGLWEQTIIVLVSDHGEGLGEDPRLPDNHGRFVYNPLVHVPMAIRIPGLQGKLVETPVSLLDVHPTLIELMGDDPRATDGVTLLPHLVPDAPENLARQTRPLPLNETDQVGVILWPHKLMMRQADALPELYDLSQDFAETRDLAESHPELLEQLQAARAALPPVEIDRSRRGRRLRDRAAAQAAPAP